MCGLGASQVVLVVKNPSAMQEMNEMQGQSLGREDLLEKEMSMHSSILPEKFHGKKSLAVYSPRAARIRHDWVRTHTHKAVQITLSLSMIIFFALL